jgi:hypothetical protein
MEWTKLTVAVNDVGQAPKVEDLARSECVDHDRELPGEHKLPSRAVPLAPVTKRVALATVEPKSHLALPPT